VIHWKSLLDKLELLTKKMVVVVWWRNCSYDWEK